MSIFQTFPKGKQAAVIRQINADMKKILPDKDTLARFALLGAEPFDSTPQELAAMLNKDIQTWAVVVKSSGAPAE